MEKILLLSISKNELEDIIENRIRKVLSELKIGGETVDKEELLTLNETANFLKLSIPTIYAYVSSRKIPFFKKNNRLYFKRNELFRWIEEGKHKTTSEIEKEAQLRLKN